MRRAKSLFVDLVLIALATVLALFLRDNLEYSPARLSALLPYLAMTLLSALFVLPALGLNKTLWRYSGTAEYWRLVTACIAIVLAAVAVGFASNRLENVSRAVPILQGLLMVTLLVGLRVAMRAHRFRHGGRAIVAPLQGGATVESVLVLGLNSIAELFIQSAAELGAGRIAIAGVIGRNESQTGRLFRSHPILGVPEDIESIVKELEVHGVFVDRIVVAVAFRQLSPYAQRALLDVENGTRIRVEFLAERLGFSAPTHEVGIKPKPEAEAGTACFSADEARQIRASLRRPYWTVKRGADAAISAITVLALLPAMLAIGFVTALSIGLPVLFWQQRPGLNGRPFKLYKFRSLLGAHTAQGVRLPDEARETPFGRFLRFTRADELPQLFNILAGHMSFVGPRPLLDIDQMTQFRDRLLVRPGLTGWAQVNGGKSVSASDKMALDIWYIRNASFLLDVRIVLLTLRMVLFGERANPVAVTQAWKELESRSLEPSESAARSGLRTP